MIPNLSNDDGNIITEGQWLNNTAHPNWHAFDASASTYAVTSVTHTAAIGCTIGYDFGTPIKVCKVTGKIRMKGYKIQYSNDGTTWHDAIEKTSPGSDSGNTFEDLIEVDESYQYWRFYVNSGQSAANWAACVYSLQFYYIKDDTKVQTFDTNPLLNKNNEQIITEGTWSESSKNSKYHAFDGDTNTYAVTTKTNTAAIGYTIGYDFGKSVKVCKVKGKIRMKGYKIQCSNDKENWQDVIEQTSVGSNTGNTFEDRINVNEACRYWRIYVNAGQQMAEWSACVWELKFYIEQDSYTVRI